MSAFVVSKSHIDAMVHAGLTASNWEFSWFHDGERHPLNHTNADEVGAMLWAENVESVGFRYSPPGRVAVYGDDLGKPADDEFELPGTYKSEMIAEGVEPIDVPEWSTPYTFPLGRVRGHTPVEILKAIDCYEYQSCEHEGWKDSSAKAFCDDLRSVIIGKLPGYSDAPWGID